MVNGGRDLQPGDLAQRVLEGKGERGGGGSANALCAHGEKRGVDQGAGGLGELASAHRQDSQLRQTIIFAG